MSTKRRKKKQPSKPLPRAPNRRLPPSIPPSTNSKYVITPKRAKPPRPPRFPTTKPPRLPSYKSRSSEYSDSDASSPHSHSHYYVTDKKRKANRIPLSRVDSYDDIVATASVEDNEIDDSIYKTETDDELPPKGYHKGSVVIHDSNSIDHKASVVFHDSDHDEEQEYSEYKPPQEYQPPPIDINDILREQMMKHNMSPIKNEQSLTNLKKRINKKRHIQTQSVFTRSTPSPKYNINGASFVQFEKKKKERGDTVHHQRVNSVPPQKPLPTLEEKEDDVNTLAIAKPMRTRNVLRQSQSPFTPLDKDDGGYDEIEFEYKPNDVKRNSRNIRNAQSLQYNQNGMNIKPKKQYKSPPNHTKTSSFNGLNEFHPSNRGKTGNRSAINKIKAKMNMKIKAKTPTNSIKIRSKNVKKSLTPTPATTKLNHARSHPPPEPKSKYNIAPKLPTPPQTVKIANNKEIPQLLFIDQLHLDNTERRSDSSSSESDSSSTTSTSSSSSSSSSRGRDIGHVKSPSHFEIRSMRHANSPRFGGNKTITPRTKTQRNKRTITPRTKRNRELNIIKANREDKESAFAFKSSDIKKNGRAHRRAPQSARFATGAVSPDRLYKKRRSRGALSYADYKRMRKKEEDAKVANETGSSIEWICGDQIGKGAFGTVYKGYDKKTGKLIAIKEFKYTFKNKEKTLKDFEIETKIMKQLKHINIVEFFDYKLVENQRLIYLIMEYVPGNSIESIYMKRGHFSEITIQKYVFQIINGLHYAHSRNIIHRDIKGKNILVDNVGCVKIADFGSATLTEKENNAKNNAWSMNFESTPLWTAPEVLTIGKYDLKIDIWSTGCCIIEMATAKRPWNEIEFKSPFQALYHIGNTDKIPLWPKSLSIQCQAFIAKCLIRDPNKRYNTKQLLQHPFLKTR